MPAQQRAFTLLEILVAITILIVLLAITLPILRSSRTAGYRAEQLSNHRQIAAAIEMYAGNERGHAPYMAVPGEPTERDPRLIGIPTAFPAYFGYQGFYFTVPLIEQELLVPDVLRTRSARIDVPEDPRTPRWSPFCLTHAVAADPAFWVGDATPNRPEWLRGVPLERIRYASRKVLLGNLDWSESGRLAFDGTWSVALADGSARRTELESSQISRGLASVSYRGLTTVDGVHGIDID